MEPLHLAALETKHANLDRLIAEESRRPAPDDMRIHQWKKEKLRIKEALLLH